MGGDRGVRGGRERERVTVEDKGRKKLLGFLGGEGRGGGRRGGKGENGKREEEFGDLVGLIMWGC